MSRIESVAMYSLRVVKDSTITYNVLGEEIRSPGDIARAMLTDNIRLHEFAEEVMYMLTLDVKLNITGTFLVSQGSLNTSIVHPREIFKRALLVNAACIIIAHNHPSGDPSPSKEDVDVTKRIRDAGELLGIELIDHLIIGSETEYVSFKEKGIL